jgi:hypothetical protein
MLFEFMCNFSGTSAFVRIRPIRLLEYEQIPHCMTKQTLCNVLFPAYETFELQVNSPAMPAGLFLCARHRRPELAGAARRMASDSVPAPGSADMVRFGCGPGLWER